MHRLWNGRARLFLIAALVLLGLVLGLLFGVLPAWEPADDGLLAGDPSGLGLRTDEEDAADRRREDALTLHGREAAGQPGPGPTDGGRGPAAEPPPGPAEIVVLSAETLAPLEGAHFLDERGERDLAEKGVEGSTSDEDGRIALEQVPVTGVSVRLTKPGYLPGVVKVRAGERVEAELLPGVPVRGRILRVGATKGSNAAEVFVWEEDLGVEIASFSTDETGAFELSAVRPNRPFLMTVRLPGLVPQGKRLVVDAPTDDLEVLVGEGGHLDGSLRTADDVPLPGIVVKLLSAGVVPPGSRERAADLSRAERAQIEAGIATTQTDASGRFAFEGISLATDVQVLALLGGRQVQRGPRLRFTEVGETRTIHLQTGPPARLRIHVQEVGGTPIGDADVEVRGAEGAWYPQASDAREGSDLVLADLPPGAVRVTATRPGAPTQEAQVLLRPDEEETVTLTFPTRRRLEGRVQDARGNPIWKALVRWSQAEEAVEVRTEMNGRFLFQRLTHPTGRVTVSARDLPASAFAYETLVVEQAEADGPPLDLTLKDGTRVRGSFEDLPPGTEVFSSMVPGTRDDDVRLPAAVPFTFVRRGPAVGRPALFVFQARGLPPLLRLEKAPFQSEEIRDLGPLFFEATNPRKGRIVDEGGKPLWAAKVSVRSSWSSANVRTDRQGDFELVHMPRIPLQLHIEADGYPTTPATLLPASEFKPQVIRLRKTVDVTLIVRAASGKPAGATRIQFRGVSHGAGRGTERAFTETTDLRGSLRLRLAPGDYEATLTPKAGARSVTQRFQLGPESPQTVTLRAP